MAGSFDELHLWALASPSRSALRRSQWPASTSTMRVEEWLSNVFTPKGLKRCEKYRGVRAGRRNRRFRPAVKCGRHSLRFDRSRPCGSKSYNSHACP